MTKPDLLALAQEERAELLELLRSLNPEQWETQSLCSGWTVRDVATHIVSYDELSTISLVGAFLRGGLRVDNTNDVVLKRYSDLGPDGVVDLVSRTQRPRGLTAMMGGGIALTDGTIHHQDIRRALALPRTIPAARLTTVLDFTLTAPTLPAKKNARGLKLVATDLEWVSGEGAEVTGPGEALLLAVAGRPQALRELSGSGLTTLRQRVR